MVLYLLTDRNKHCRFGALNFVSSYISSKAKAIRNAKYIHMDEPFTYIKMSTVPDYMKITIYRATRKTIFRITVHAIIYP
jgi:hypothetical protein